jgi:hypothetical protein
MDPLSIPVLLTSKQAEAEAARNQLTTRAVVRKVRHAPWSITAWARRQVTGVPRGGPRAPWSRCRPRAPVAAQLRPQPRRSRARTLAPVAAQLRPQPRRSRARTLEVRLGVD